ncbi:MAG: SRPBCC domain-containing protein [Alphaproteobacteria bacterium]|nr:SRPBCC domain-containing protein [Alphaproteobacteria bacterium]
MIEPVVVELTIDRPPGKVFELFTRRITEWWPLETHSLGASDEKPPQMVVMEPHVEGRIYEVSQDGAQRLWGSVIAWEPGTHVAFTWHVGREPERGTQVSVRFQLTDSGGTHITLRHDNWHRLGDEAEEQRQGYETGWPALLNDDFLPFVSANS